MDQITFEVPPGLGDITWCYQKVSPILREDLEVRFRICGNPPHRGSDFVDLLPGITNLGYGRSYKITKQEALPYHIDLSTLSPGTYSLTLNPHLEAGGKLRWAFPQQETDYHFSLNTSDRHRFRAKSWLDLAGRSGFKIGFYCSSYAHRPDLGFWSVDEWLLFLQFIKDIVPGVEFIALGAKYDDRTLDVYSRAVKAGIPVTSAIGTANVGDTVELIRGLDYLFAFPSGLAILADVVRTPCLMWYWSNLVPECENFLDTYADPEHVESGFHINLPYLSVLPSVDRFVERGLPHLLKRT